MQFKILHCNKFNLQRISDDSIRQETLKWTEIVENGKQIRNHNNSDRHQ